MNKMNDHKGNILGTLFTGFFAILSKLGAHFESHAQTYAALAAVIVASFTVTNIIRGWLKERKTKP